MASDQDMENPQKARIGLIYPKSVEHDKIRSLNLHSIMLFPSKILFYKYIYIEI